MTDTLDRLEREFLPSPPARILELGCGNGMSWSLLMAGKGYEVHGIDISEIAIVWAKEQFAERRLSGAFRKGNVCEMPFIPDASFDIVMDGSCLHCLIGCDRTRCLQEVHRILRADGVFVVSTMCGLPKSDDAKARFDPVNGQLLQDGRAYRTLKPLKDIVREVMDARFEVRESTVSVNPWWDHATMAVASRRPRSPDGANGNRVAPRT
ncbi:class I SAM-dependent methyltransferase [Bradyrhizobium sp. sGM-13]|uniref:class I SAM-dependent methyltransferase n=1 Tax=Bradyrhizobium sp. sGM-13 TaxID=2831781 RepID=UPI001BCFD26F|nr:class I SAM-dependent methyltransferase [Bradyrhizobium sp. sGM-13]